MTEAEQTEKEKLKAEFKDVSVVLSEQKGQITLPKGMKIDKAIKALQLKEEEEEAEVSINEEIDAYPLDGANAFMLAMQQKYGWATPQPTPGFFGNRPPNTVSVKISHNESIQIIWGQFKIPGLDGFVECGANWDAAIPNFMIHGKTRKKFLPEIKELAELTRKIAKEKSIYKAKALLLKTEENGYLNPEEAPDFLNLENVNSQRLIFPMEVMEDIETNIFTPIEKTEICRDNKIPLKRGVLLEGPYGTGKTLTAYVTAKKCVENGWTFVYLDRVTGLRDALIFARRYAPAVVFSEDIDRILSGDRDVKIDDVLNNIDGIDSKSAEVMVVLTTNHVELIQKGMMRPGRLDAVISIQPPDALACQELIRVYARNLLSAEEDISIVGEELKGNIPAVIREVVERSKLYAISRDGKHMKNLTAADLLKSAKAMIHHLILLKEPETKETSVHEQLGRAFDGVVSERLGNGIGHKLDNLKELVEQIPT